MHDLSEPATAPVAQLWDRRTSARPALAAAAAYVVAPPLLSIVTPAYNEAANLAVLHERLAATLDPLGVDWEWVIVDDHSTDDTFAAIGALRARDPRVRGVRFAHNFGSHTAMICGLHHVRGRCTAIMAADLQDPPATLPALMAEWRKGAHVVWAVRRRREGERTSTIAFARVYYWMMRRIVGIRDMPETGADFALIDARVVEAVRRFRESNVSILALITWMGYRQAEVAYDKQQRLHGRSGWSLAKKLKLVVDSVTSFTSLPIRAMSYVGFLVALLGFLYAAFIVVHSIGGRPVEGWSSLMVTLLVIGGVQMLMMGVLGEYLWRALDESRQRPRYLVEATVGDDLDAERPAWHEPLVRPGS
jgi:polyisoprenyl-phosphate glycosyltransferase